jgi:hypothetical protein
MTYTDLQNGLYNLISQAIGLGPSSGLQLVQPSVPLPSSTSDITLWNYMNNIPPFSLTQTYTQSGGNQFFSDYEALMSALVPSLTIDLEKDITPPVYKDWLAYVASLPSPPAVMQLPNLFLNWAYSTHPAVAEKGASDLSALILEPIHQAQLALLPYLTVAGLAGGKPPDWTPGYAQLVAQLARSPGKQASSPSVQAGANVGNSWTRGSHSGFFGLWGGSASNSPQSAVFASQPVSLSVSFAHVTTFAPVPGPWYNSAAFGLAYSTQTGNPWNPNSAINWQSTFGPNGNLQRIASSLVVVSGMRVTATSTARFSAADQAMIRQNAGAGLWPFYAGNNGNVFSTSQSFKPTGEIAISTSSQDGIPIVLGVNVLTDSQYTGHATAGLKLFRQLAVLKLGRLPAIGAAVISNE